MQLRRMRWWKVSLCSNFCILLLPSPTPFTKSLFSVLCLLLFNTKKVQVNFIDLTGEASRSKESHIPWMPFVLATSAPGNDSKSTDKESQGTDHLKLEVEVQDLMERVSVLESGQAYNYYWDSEINYEKSRADSREAGCTREQLVHTLIPQS